jgi:hypothetical protein
LYAHNLEKKGRLIMSRQKSFKVIALLLAVGIMQASAQLCFAQPAFLASAAFPQPQLLARLTTKGNQPITVNGTSATSGDSVANEAIIETPANVDASVDLGPLGSIDIAPGTRIKLEYDGACIPGSGSASGPSLQCGVKVTVFAGCITSHYKSGSYHQAVTDQQSVIKDSDKSRKSAGSFNTCIGGPPAGAAAAGGGLSTAAKVALIAAGIGGGGVIIWAATKDSSPSTP